MWEQVIEVMARIRTDLSGRQVGCRVLTSALRSTVRLTNFVCLAPSTTVIVQNRINNAGLSILLYLFVVPHCELENYLRVIGDFPCSSDGAGTKERESAEEFSIDGTRQANSQRT